MDEGKRDLVKRYFLVSKNEEEAKDIVGFIEENSKKEMDRVYKNIQKFFIELAEENGYISPDCIDEVCSDRARDYAESKEDAYS